jgi:hypothetical protein
VLVLSPPWRTVIVLVLESTQPRQNNFSAGIELTFIEHKSQSVRVV